MGTSRSARLISTGFTGRRGYPCAWDSKRVAKEHTELQLQVIALNPEPGGG